VVTKGVWGGEIKVEESGRKDEHELLWWFACEFTEDEKAKLAKKNASGEPTKKRGKAKSFDRWSALRRERMLKKPE